MSLLLDSANSHGTKKTMPVFENVKFLFLPPSTTSVLQPLDEGNVEALNWRYFKFQYEHAVMAIDPNVPVSSVYFVDQLMSMKKATKI